MKDWLWDGHALMQSTGKVRRCERMGKGSEKLEESEERKSWGEGGGAFKSGVGEIDYTEVNIPRSGGAKSRRGNHRWTNYNINI